MSKITFRADEELVEELETFDASKSEVMRRALREYLDQHAESAVNAAQTPGSGGSTTDQSGGNLDDLIRERVDELVEQRLDERGVGRRRPQDLNVNITLDGDSDPDIDANEPERMTQPEPVEEPSDTGRKRCGQCGENVGSDHVYCPNCGEKASHRVFCDCGDEIRTDWAFCPSCGRRTPAADVLDSGGPTVDG